MLTFGIAVSSEVTRGMIRGWIEKNDEELCSVESSILKDEILPGVDRYESSLKCLVSDVCSGLFSSMTSYRQEPLERRGAIHGAL